MRAIRFLFVLMMISCGPEQRSDDASKWSGSPADNIQKMLPIGEYKVDVMDQVSMSARTQELMQKFQTAMQKNPEWFLEAQQKVQETGDPLPYDERIGMTEDEYDEFLELMQENNGVEMTISGTETITIDQHDNKITFSASGHLEPLNDLVIDLANASATFGPYTLPKIDVINVTDDNNALKSRWSGYEWRFESSNKEMDELKTVEDYKTLDMEICKVIIATLEKTKRTYMHVQVSQIKSGQKTVDYQMPFLFK